MRDSKTTTDTRGKTLDEVHLLLSARIAKLQHLAEQEDGDNKGKFSELAFTIEELEEVQSEIRSMQTEVSDD